MPQRLNMLKGKIYKIGLAKIKTMDTKTVLNQLTKKYPGKLIIKNDEKNPTEILCEIKPTKDHPRYSLAISVIGKSDPHYHKKLTETYKVVKGKLKLIVEGKIINLGVGQKYIIKPNQTHWAIGDETWIECYSKPGWTPKDHILV